MQYPEWDRGELNSARALFGNLVTEGKRLLMSGGRRFQASVPSAARERGEEEMIGVGQGQVADDVC